MIANHLILGWTSKDTNTYTNTEANTYTNTEALRIQIQIQLQRYVDKTQLQETKAMIANLFRLGQLLC